ncbi:MAG: VOC family protein [Acidimicrobiia bacterium]|nr:VOC family protein [Acidimicrobiia bacterium]
MEFRALMGFVPVTDLDAVEGFYSEVLGFPLLRREPGALVYRMGEHLLRVVPVGGVEVSGRFTHLGWIVDDIEATVADLTAKGVEFHRFDFVQSDDAGIHTFPDGGDRVAWFEDPEGNVLSVTEAGHSA